MSEDNITYSLRDTQFRHEVLQAVSDLSEKYGLDDGLRQSIDILTKYELDLLRKLMEDI